MSDSHRSRAEPGGEPLEQEADKNLLIQQALNAILRISLEPISLDEQMHRVLDLLLKLPWLALEAQGCIFLVENDASALVMKVHIGMSAGVLSSCRRVPFGTCLCGRAIAANEIVFANCVDACHSILYPGIQPHGHYCVPISSGGRRVGLLNLYVREGHQQSLDEERFLRAVADVLAGVIERQRTQERLQEQLRLAAFGRDVGLALSQSDRLPDMLRQCAEALVRHLDGAFARIWTLNEAEDVLELQASAGLYTHTDGAHRRVPVGHYKIGLIAQERKPHLSNDVLADPRVHDQGWARREGLVAFAGYPLLVEDRLVGVMAMFARQPLSEATLEAMASVANGVALGIERKRTQERLLEQLSERKKAERRLTAEHRVSRILAVSQTLNDAALEVVQALCESLDWDVGTVWVADPKGNVLRCVEIWHRPGVEVAAFEEVTRRRTFSPGVGMPGRVWASEKPIWVPDVSVDANFPRRQVAAQCGLHGAVGFPIWDGEQVQGVLEFFNREIRQPDDELIQMMTSIGSEITQFIERRQAQRELQRQAEDRHIARQIQQGLLPKAMPTLPGFRISGRSLSANDVGGDCFDFIPLSVEGQECLGVLLADASGHGIAAALLVAKTRAYLRALAMTYTGVDNLLTLTNRRLTADLVTDHFVSLFLAQLNPRTRSLDYANAGHCPGYVLDRQGEIKTVLAGTGGLVGIDQASEFSTGPTIKLESGELAFLYTDGIVEAMSRDGRLFGLESTLNLVRGHRHKTPDEIVDKLFDVVSAFSEGNIQDDLTAVIIKAEGTA
jgi:serine phosphatase RsbU (regulator of sigma subunit)/putative methionine-R-sulfoxide reductase with GAF domain